MKKVQIRNQEDKAIVSTLIDAHLTFKGECEVIIKNIDESITDAQRSLYFVWCGVIGADLGNTKDEQHQYCKERYLLNIYIDDPENHPEFKGVAENMNIIKQQCPDEFWPLRRLVLDGLTIRTATKENMIELLNEVEGMARGLDIRLPAPPRDGLR